MVVSIQIRQRISQLFQIATPVAFQHPGATFEVQADDTFPVTDLAGNFDIVDQSPVGDTTSGTSRLELDVTTGATTATLPLKAIDISQDPENSDVSSANTNVIVKINNHLFSAGTAGLA